MISPGEEIALKALKKEHKALLKKAEKARLLSQECILAASTSSQARDDAIKLINQNLPPREMLEKLETLEKVEKRASMLMKKDISKVFDAEFEAEHRAKELGKEIFKIEMRKGYLT